MSRACLGVFLRSPILLFSARLFDDEAFVLIALLSILVQGEATAEESIQTPSVCGKEKVCLKCVLLPSSHKDHLDLLDRKDTKSAGTDEESNLAANIGLEAVKFIIFAS